MSAIRIFLLSVCLGLSAGGASISTSEATPIATDSLQKVGDQARDCVGSTFLSEHNPNAIRFNVWCGVQSGKVRFTLRRGEQGVIERFDKRLGVGGRWIGSPFRCYRLKEAVRCLGGKQGPVTVRGWITVARGSRCAVAANLSTEGLLSGGKPLGCPGTRPPQLGRRMAAHMRGFRRNFGLDLDLDSDRAAVDRRIRGIIRAWKRGEPVARYTDVTWGVPLRARDQRELEYRDDYLEQFNEALHPWIRLHAQTTYAGYAMDHEHGGIIYVGFVGDQDAQLGAFLSSFSSIAPSRFKPFPVPPKYSMAHLFKLQMDVGRQLARPRSGPGQFIYRVGINLLDNVVEVGTDHVEEVRGLIVETYGQDAPISVVFSLPLERALAVEVALSRQGER